MVWPTARGRFLTQDRSEEHDLFDHEDTAFWRQVRTLQEEARGGRASVVRMRLLPIVGWTPTVPPFLFEGTDMSSTGGWCPSMLDDEADVASCAPAGPLLRSSGADSPLGLPRDLRVTLYVQGRFDGTSTTMADWLLGSRPDVVAYRARGKVFSSHSDEELRGILHAGEFPVFVVEDWCVDHDPEVFFDGSDAEDRKELEATLSELEANARLCARRSQAAD